MTTMTINISKLLCWSSILLLLLLAAPSKAQTARQILDKTAALVGNKGGASASFTMTSGKTKASGTISIKGRKFYAKASGAEVWYDGKTQWAYMASTHEVNVTTPTEAQQQQMNPYTFLNIYKNGYTLTKSAVAGGWQVHLVAQNKQRSVQELYVTVSKSYQPKSIKMRSGKAWTTITVSNFRKQTLSDATFRFNAKKYPKAEVIDLR